MRPKKSVGIRYLSFFSVPFTARRWMIETHALTNAAAAASTTSTDTNANASSSTLKKKVHKKKTVVPETTGETPSTVDFSAVLAGLKGHIFFLHKC